MDIRQLKHLVALVELGTVHAAAKDQHISQPGLSGSIKRLETQLGVPLFERDGRGMKPNTRGQDFYRHAKHILEQLRLAEAELDGTPTSLIIGVGEVRPARFVAALHDGLLQRYPNLRVTFVEEHFETLYAQVENAEVDVAFFGAPPDSIPPALMGQTLAKSEFFVYCAADHPLSRHPGPVPIAELKKYSWIRNAAAPSSAPYLPNFTGRKQDVLETARVITAGSQQMAKDLLIHSHALGFGPRIAFDVELEHEQVVELDLPIKKVYVPITEVRRRDAYSTVLDQAFAIAEDYYQNRQDV